MLMYEVYAEERKNGATIKETAEKYGVSFSCVSSLTATRKLSQFKPFKPSQIIYPNLRSWMNYNEVSISELVRRFGGSQSTATKNKFGDFFKGRKELTRDAIEKIMAVTGMTYEQLFWQESMT